VWRGQDDEVDDDEVVAALRLLPAARAKMEQLETAVLFTARAQGLSWEMVSRAMGLGSAPSVAARYGVDPDLALELLLDFEAREWVQHSSFGDRSGWSMTNAGRRQATLGGLTRARLVPHPVDPVPRRPARDTGNTARIRHVGTALAWYAGLD